MINESSSVLVLENHDLLDLIFDFFDLDAKRALLRAALTSRSFAKFALDKLWRNMDSLWPLCLLLTANNWYNHTINGVNDHLLERVLSYARRIRVLRLDTEHASLPDRLPNVELFSRISDLGGFHSLRELRIHSDYLTWLFTFPVSAPNLEVLEFLTYPEKLPDTVSPFFLQEIALESPHLKTLKMYTNTFSKATFDVLPCFKHLQCLSLNITHSDISISFLKHCAKSMTSLKSLVLCFIPLRFVDDFDQPGNPRELSTFRSLSRLDLTGTPNTIQTILNVIYVPSLISLRFSFCGFDFFDINPYLQHFIAVHGQLLKTRLRSLSLVGSRSVKIDLVSYLKPFKTFEQLDDVHIDSGLHIPTSILTLDLQEIAFLPNLTKLRLLYNDSNGLNNALSIAALPLLADLCPKLLHLTIAIFNSDQAAMRKTRRRQVLLGDTTNRGSHNLETLTFCWLPQDWEYSGSLITSFSAFLWHLFPRLKIVRYSSDVAYSHVLRSHTQWVKDVQEMLKIHQRRAITGTESFF